MRLFSTKNILGEIKKGLSTLALGLLVVGTAQAEIIDFQAHANQCNTVLSWTSDGNPDIRSYEVQKSADGISFTTLTTVRRGNGNSYEFTTRQTEAQMRYRIIENHNSTFPTASTIRIVKSECNTGIIIDTPAIGFYPNPMLASIGGDLHITLENEGAKMLDIQITDITGRVILKQNNELHRGLNQIDMNVGELAIGTYLIVTSADGAAPKANRFIVQK